MAALADRVYHVLLWAVGTLLGVLTVVVSYQVLGRYLEFIPRALWTEEIARLSLEWLVFLGAALAIRRNEHFVVDLIPRRFDERFRKPVQLVILAFVAVGAVVFLLGGLAFADTGASRTSTTSGISLVWAFSAIPVSAAVMLFFVAELAVRTIKGESVAELGQDLVDESAVDSSHPGVEGLGE